MRSVPITLQTANLTRADFLNDSHARRYSDVVNDPRIDFDEWLSFFSDPLRQLRLLDAEIHHDRPALGGVVTELESHPAFALLSTEPRSTTNRHRQAIGVIVKLIMERHGWRTTGNKGFLGGGRANGFSKFFGTAEHYQR